MNFTTRLSKLYTGAVHDVMRAMGISGFILPNTIQSLDPAKKIAGEIYTVKGESQKNEDGHKTLVEWTGLLSKAPRGKVLVCQPNTKEIALMGELSAETLQKKGVLGYVVDGGCRDVEFILKLGFPVFCSFTTPADIVGRWLPVSFGAPIKIGDVEIHSGDYILGDRDGVIVIPHGKLDEIITTTENVIKTENKVRSAILDGLDPQEAYLKYGKF